MANEDFEERSKETISICSDIFYILYRYTGLKETPDFHICFFSNGNEVKLRKLLSAVVLFVCFKTQAKKPGGNNPTVKTLCCIQRGVNHSTLSLLECKTSI